MPAHGHALQCTAKYLSVLQCTARTASSDAAEEVRANTVLTLGSIGGGGLESCEETTTMLEPGGWIG